MTAVQKVIKKTFLYDPNLFVVLVITRYSVLLITLLRRLLHKITQFGKILLSNLYPGVNLIVFANNQNLYM